LELDDARQQNTHPAYDREPAGIWSRCRRLLGSAARACDESGKIAGGRTPAAQAQSAFRMSWLRPADRRDRCRDCSVDQRLDVCWGLL
jgi:hypothetical protein